MRKPEALQITLVIATAAKFPDIRDRYARCYSCAHAAASLICNAQGRIFGRPVDQHGKLASELIDRWGRNCTDVLGMLTDVCS